MSKPINFDPIKSFFDRRLHEYGASPRGLDWNSEASQQTRFAQLLKVVEGESPFSILDYGCGYGALADYLAAHGFTADYIGFDILPSAIDLARSQHAGMPRCTFMADKSQLPVCDYTVASGIFNFRADQSDDDWLAYILSTLQEFDQRSRRGFASNFLTKYSDAEKMRPELYYADPLFLFDHCKRHFSKNVALLHDYRLYDFTIIIRKD